MCSSRRNICEPTSSTRLTNPSKLGPTQVHPAFHHHPLTTSRNTSIPEDTPQQVSTLIPGTTDPILILIVTTHARTKRNTPTIVVIAKSMFSPPLIRSKCTIPLNRDHTARVPGTILGRD